MKYRFQDDCDDIAWDNIPKLLELVGMSFCESEVHRISFENSYASIFVFDEDKLIGFGRMISDGVRQSALYDIAINPDYQGQGIGKEIVSRLIAKTPNCNIILYASPGKENFYKRLKFKKMKTGMAFFSNPERMTDGVFVED